MTRRRRWTTTLMIAALAILGTATPARAATTWQYNDDMGRPSYLYFYDYPSQASIKTAPGTKAYPVFAHSLPYVAELDAGYGQAWSSIYQYIHITPAENGARPSCVFSAWTNSGYEAFNIEVIDQTTWTYIGLGQHTGTTFWQWEKMATPAFRPAVADVVIRVSMLGPYPYPIIGFVDDFNVTCTS